VVAAPGGYTKNLRKPHSHDASAVNEDENEENGINDNEIDVFPAHVIHLEWEGKQ
jgi:hypothetical protein